VVKPGSKFKKEHGVKVQIIGHVEAENGVLSGIVELPDVRAKRLISLGAAVAADIVAVDAIAGNTAIDYHAAADHAQNVLKNQSETIEQQAEKIGLLEGIVQQLKDANEQLERQIVEIRGKVPAEDKPVTETKKSGKK
jgi:predicted RNase H-like nuclease (RuvC/YqgF family)